MIGNFYQKSSDCYLQVNLTEDFCCREQQKKLVDAEQELAAAKSHGYVSKFEQSSNKSQLQAVIGIMTTFGGQPRRASSRKSWLPTGKFLLEPLCSVRSINK